MKNTTIGWTDHTINFWWGCTQVSPACLNCYAEKFAAYAGNRVFGHLIKWGAGQSRGERLAAARKEAMALNLKAFKLGTRYRVFVNSMSDWLDEEVPTQWLAWLLETIFLCPNLDFQLLTKRPQNWRGAMEAVITYKDDGPIFRCKSIIANWLINLPPANVWIGTTVEDQVRANLRIPQLLAIPAKVRFLSMEPLLSSVRIEVPSAIRPKNDNNSLMGGINWLITGGESGAADKHRFTHPDWIRSLRDQCLAAGVPFFFKQWGDWIPLDQLPEDKAHDRMKGRWVSRDGYSSKHNTTDADVLMVKLGVKNAGNLLDSSRWEEFPKP
jgi:protein gp37